MYMYVGSICCCHRVVSDSCTKAGTERPQHRTGKLMFSTFHHDLKDISWEFTVRISMLRYREFRQLHRAKFLGSNLVHLVRVISWFKDRLVHLLFPFPLRSSTSFGNAIASCYSCAVSAGALDSNTAQEGLQGLFHLLYSDKQSFLLAVKKGFITSCSEAGTPFSTTPTVCLIFECMTLWTLVSDFSFLYSFPHRIQAVVEGRNRMPLLPECQLCPSQRP